MIGGARVIDERREVVKVECNLHSVRASSWNKGLALEMSAGYFDVVKLRKECVGDVVDGDTIDGNKCVLGPLTKGSGEVEDVFDGGWVRVLVVDGRDPREAVRSKDVDVE